MKETMSYLAGLFYVAAFLPYVHAILQKKTKPKRATWIVWASLDIITLAAMYKTDTVNWQILGATVGALIVAGLSLKFGIPGWKKLDKLCLAGAILGIAFWKTFSSPTLGIMISLCVGFLGSFPTFESAWKHPERENKWAWTIFWISCVFAVIAIRHWTLDDAAQPIMFLVIETIMMYILFVHARSLVKRKTR